ncbi:unnamed protein product [Paramecium sonneborni]|uniref:Uncharacterized protein n=1 Tax=Paramecium sonneborni TaxID=65129 RepID=A0A8S1KI55_9CILI|nr:unnamed protein product [Paramecium sonneborni]
MLIILLLLHLGNCGHISSWDVQLDYTNAGYASRFTIPFKLSNPLPNFGYLRMKFPFALHYTNTNNVPDNVIVTFKQAKGNYQCGEEYEQSAQVFVNNGENNAYYIKFGIELTSNEYYYVNIHISGKNLNIQSSGVKEPIQLATVTSISAIAMIIDYTPVGGIFALDLEPSSDMRCSISETINTMNQLYNVTVGVQFKKQMNEGARVQLIFNSDFNFEGSCTLQNDIPYQCTLASNMIVYLIKQYILVNDWLYFQVTVRNPLRVTLPTSLEIRSLQQYANTINERTVSQPVFQVKQVFLSTHKLYLGWGLEYSSRSSYYYPFPIIVFRGDVAGKYTPYNAFKWQFAMATDLPEDIQLQIEVSTPMKFKSYLMSISHNLPSYPGKQSQCVFTNINRLSQSKIVCYNVGQLYLSTTYYIGCRATFPYDQFNLPLEQKFGSMNIYTVTNGIKDTLSVIVESNPVEYIQTNNNPDWLNPSYDGTVVSSQKMDVTILNDPLTNTLGIIPNLDDGDIELIRLKFNLAIKIDKIITPATTPVLGTQKIAYSAGIIIIANNNIQMSSTDPANLECASLTASQFFKYDYKSSNLANFLAITVASSDAQGLLNMFVYNTNELQTKFLQFAISNLQAKFHSSLYADEHLLDFYIGSFDQIESTYPIFKQSFLTNAYTITSPAPSYIRLGIVNYFSSSSSGNTCDYFPTLIRLSGYFQDTDVENAQTKISLFFTNLQPIYISSDFENDNRVYCKYTGQTQPTCSYFSSGLLGNGQSYLNYERLDIEFESLATNQADAFQLLIPVKTFASNPKVSFFLAAVVDINGLIEIRTSFRLTGHDNINSKQYTFPVGVPALGNGFARAGITTASDQFGNPAPYQLQVSSALTVGKNNTDLTFFIGHNDVSFVNINTVANDNQNGGGFTLVSTSPFYTSDSIIKSPISVDSSKVSGCVTFEYLTKFVIFCPTDKASDSPLTTLTIKAGNLPFNNGDKLPYRTVYAWSDKVNGLGIFRVDSDTLITLKGVVKILQVWPKLEIGQKQQRVQIRFYTTNPIPNQATIRLEFLDASSIKFDAINKGSRCLIETALYGILSHTCTVSRSTSGAQVHFLFKITNCDSCPWTNGQFILNFWGLNSQYSGTVSKSSFDIRIMSEYLNTIDLSKVQGAIDYDDNPDVKYEAFFGNPKFQFYNRRAKGQISVDFQFTRSIWKQEYVLINIGGFFDDNQRNKNNIICQVQQLGQPSYLFGQSDYTLDRGSSVSGIKLYPIDDIIGSQIFTLKCYGMVIPFSLNPEPMIASLILQGTFLIIQSSGTISLDSLYEETILPIKNIQLTQKLNNLCGSTTDFFINVTTTLIDVKLGTSIFVVFPTTYPFIVSSNLTYCSLNSLFVACSVDVENTVILENFDISIPKGQEMQIRIYGAQNSAIFNDQANEIFVAFTNNIDTTVLGEYGVIYDYIGQDMVTTPPINILTLWIDTTQQYIRSFSTITFKVTFPPGAIEVSNLIQIEFPPAWDMIINYKLPICSLYDQNNITNYAKSCINFGNRVTITIKQSDYIGSQYYYLILANVRNPDYAVCGINMWTLTVLNSTYVFGRSHAPNFNIPIFPFISNPNQVTLKWIDMNTKQSIRTLQVKTGIFNQVIGLASDAGLFLRTFQIYSDNPYFTANPTNTIAPMGQAYTTFTIAGTSKAPQGLQLIEFAKTDDFEKHTQLPFLRVFLSQTFCTLNTEMTLYQLTLGGQALPILFNLTDCQPAANLRIEATSDTDKIYFKSKSSITFGLNQKVGAFLFASEDSGISVGDSGLISFQVSGSYQKYYTTVNPISYRIIDINKKRPLSNLYSIDRGSNYVKFLVTCNQYAVVYYYISINGSEILYPEEIQQKTFLWIEPSIDDYYHQFFGLKNIFIPFKNYTVVVSGLRPSTTYNITTVCKNVETKFSTAQTILQTTKSNNGKSFYIDLIFDSEIDLEFSISITCFLTQQFKVPARLIRNSINSWCSLQRRRLLSNTTNVYSEKNVRMYVSLIDFELQDTVTASLLAKGINKTQFIADLFEQVAGLPNLVKLSDLTAISTTVPIFQQEVVVNITNNSILLQNISLDQEGFVYCMIDFNNRTKMPTFYDLRQGNALRKPENATYYERQRFNKSTSLNFTFDQLIHYTNYSIYYYASNDDPSEHQIRTYVYQINFRTEPKYEMWANIIIIILSMNIILI